MTDSTTNAKEFSVTPLEPISVPSGTFVSDRSLNKTESVQSPLEQPEPESYNSSTLAPTAPPRAGEQPSETYCAAAVPLTTELDEVEMSMREVTFETPNSVPVEEIAYAQSYRQVQPSAPPPVAEQVSTVFSEVGNSQERNLEENDATQTQTSTDAKLTDAERLKRIRVKASSTQKQNVTTKVISAVGKFAAGREKAVQEAMKRDEEARFRPGATFATAIAIGKFAAGREKGMMEKMLKERLAEAEAAFNKERDLIMAKAENEMNELRESYAMEIEAIKREIGIDPLTLEEREELEQ